MDQQALRLLVHRCGNEEMAIALNISRTLKQEQVQACKLRDRLTTKEIQVATMVWQGLTNRDIASALRTSEQLVNNYLRTAFDKLGCVDSAGVGALRGQPPGGASWHIELGAGPLPTRGEWRMGPDDGPLSSSGR